LRVESPDLEAALTEALSYAGPGPVEIVADPDLI